MDTDNAQTVPAEATAPAAEAPATAPAKETKSIVPSRYAGRYKTGGSDALAEFIKKECSGKDGFEFPAFFALARKNLGGSLTEEKVAHYEGQVAAKRHGAEGRARMTIRNMLATTARKNGKLVGLNGEEVAIDLPKPVLTGAAAAAKAASGTGEQAPSETAGPF